MVGYNKGGEYVIRNRVLYKLNNRKKLLGVPGGMYIKIIREVHSRGHFVAAKTEKNIKQEFYIPRLTQTVEAVITN